jgi:hypothetical protein
MNRFESDEQDVLRTKTKEKRDLWTFVAAVNHEPEGMVAVCLRRLTIGQRPMSRSIGK